MFLRLFSGFVGSCLVLNLQLPSNNFEFRDKFRDQNGTVDPGLSCDNVYESFLVPVDSCHTG